LVAASSGCTAAALVALGGGAATALFLDALSAIRFSDGLFRRGDLREGSGDDLAGLGVVDEIVEGGNQLLLAEVVEIGLIFTELELGLLVLDLSDEFDGIKVDTLTGI
jgi:hypothetical protein